MNIRISLIPFRHSQLWMVWRVLNLTTSCSHYTMYCCFKKKLSTNAFLSNVIVFLSYLMLWDMRIQQCVSQLWNCACICWFLFKEVFRITSVSTSCMCFRFSFSINQLLGCYHSHMSQVGLVDALQASLKSPTSALRLKVAALLRIFINSKDRDVISLVLASGCNRLFPHVIIFLSCI